MRGAWLTAAGALAWIPQAALIAGAIASLAGLGEGVSPLHAAVGVLLLALVRAALEWLGGRIAFEASAAAVDAARVRLAGHLATRSPRDADRTPAGTLASLGAEKLDGLLGFEVRMSVARCRVALVPPCVAIAVASQSWAAALILLVAGPLVPVFMAIIGMAARDAGRRQVREIGQASGVFLDRLRGLADIRALGAQDRVAGEFAARAEALRTQTMAVLRVAFLSSAVLELLAALGVAMLAIYVGFSLLGTFSFGTWGEGLTVFAGLWMLMLVPEFFAPLREFAAAWHDRATAQAVEEEFDAETTADAGRIIGAGASVAPLPGAATVALEGVRATAAAAPLDLVFEPGERVALTGPSGSGKTTLLLALAGLVAPAAGSIRVAGQLLDDAHADGWRRRVAWIGQHPHFVAGSIRANVALGADPKDTAGIEAALAGAAAAGFVARAPEGLATRIGETGQGVSGGEGRRLAIARALHAHADLVLADEPTADLDPDTAADVTRGLLALAARGATLIVATHDEGLAARMDRVVRLAPGPRAVVAGEADEAAR